MFRNGTAIGTFLLLVILSGIRSEAQTKPTAVEVFQLRSMCQALGEKLDNDSAYGSYWTSQVTTNVSLKSLHCYVLLVRSPADLTTPTDRYKINTYLYDGQTKELLASMNKQGKEAGFGQIYDEYEQGPLIGYENAQTYINKMMLPER